MLPGFAASKRTTKVVSSLPPGAPSQASKVVAPSGVASVNPSGGRRARDQEGSWYYENGEYAFYGEKTNLTKKGSWTYPNGKFAYYGEKTKFTNKGCWKYPNGKFAFYGEETNYKDKGSWKYSSGKFAFYGQNTNYTAKGSWKYPDGKFAYYGEQTNYTDKGCWKYPNGSHASSRSSSEGESSGGRDIESTLCRARKTWSFPATSLALRVRKLQSRKQRQ